MAKKTKSRIPEKQEYNYRSTRRGLGSGLILDSVWTEQLKTHLGKEYRNEKETEATLQLTGFLEVFKRNYKFMATKQDMKRMFMLSEKKRWDKGFGLSREDAVARFFTGENPRQINLSARPSDLQAKRDYPNYAPRFGSSKGKLSTKQIGAQKVVKDLKQMLRTLFSRGDGAKKKVKTPNMNIERTVSKTIDKL